MAFDARGHTQQICVMASSLSAGIGTHCFPRHQQFRTAAGGPLVLSVVGNLILLWLLLAAFPMPGLDAAPATGPGRSLRVAIDNNYPPYSFLSSEGRLQGILVDRWNLWSRKTGIPVELQGLQWLAALDMMRAGEFDVLDTIFRTQERDTWFDFSEPHTRIEVTVFFHRELRGIEDLRSLHGLRVAAKGGDAVVSMLGKEGLQSIVVLNSHESIVLGARNGDFKTFVIDKPAGVYFLNKYGLSADYHFTTPVLVGNFHRAYPKGERSRMAEVEEGFSRLTEAEVKAINERWQGGRLVDETGSYRLLLTVTLCILLFCLVLLGWITALRWQVKKRTSALAESESRFREAVDFMPVPVGIVDDEGRGLLLNKEFTSRFGYTQEQVPTMEEWVRRAYPDPVYLAKAQAQWSRDVEEAITRRSNTPTRTYQIQALDGSRHEVEITMRPVGRLFITIFNDVTERNRTENELRRSETQYRRLHESIQDAYVRITLDGRIIETNRAFRELLGYSAEELSSLHYNDFTPEKWHAQERELVQRQILTRGYSEVYEKEYLRKDGSIIPVELRSFMIIGEDGQPEQMWAIVRDLSERRRLEAQLLQAQKMEAIGQLAGGVAHDFNNILAALMLNVGMLQTDMARDEERARTIGEIQDDLNRAAELTRQLLAFSRRQAMQMSTLRVEPILGKSVRMLQRILGEHITIDDSRIGELPELVANAGMIEQMLTNLCLNARDAMPQGGTLTIAATTEKLDEFEVRQHPGCRPGTYVRISIQDTGMGMDEAMRRRIFEPFFTTKEIGHGTGLGLSIVLGIVQQHSGWIDVESSPGKGSTFTVHLPTSAGLGKPAPGRTHAAVSREGHERILLVEDEANVRKALGTGLERLGYSVQAAASASEAFVLWQCSSGDFDLLITDIIMPGGVNGIELAIMLKRQKQNLKVIVSSGYHKELEGATLEEAGEFTRMPKPYTIEMLSTTIREVLDGAA